MRASVPKSVAKIVGQQCAIGSIRSSSAPIHASNINMEEDFFKRSAVVRLVRQASEMSCACESTTEL